MRKIAFFFITALMVLALVGTATAKEKFYGNVEKMPEKGYVGPWVVDGKTIQMLDGSKVDMDHGRPEIGSFVKVKGLNYDGKFLVYELEVKKGNFNPPAKK